MSAQGPGSCLIRGGLLLTPEVLSQDGTSCEAGDVLIKDGLIAALGALDEGAIPEGIQVLEAAGAVVMPGIVQAHVHLCQTLCRGQADELPLLAWLRERVWPYEAALDEEAIAWAARLGCAELLLGGTTCVLDMGTVRNQDALTSAVEKTGMRATLGKAMMDLCDGAPAALRETTRESLAESDALAGRWHGQAAGRIRYAYAPRFVLSSSEALLRQVGERVAHAGAGGPRLHTHAAEQLDEIALVRERLGRGNIDGLLALGIGGERAVFAHCVHLSEQDRALLSDSGTHVAHCPSSNLKLGSGIAPVVELLQAGVNVALGADGAPCNNNLDGLLETRLCALLQKGRKGPGALSARRVLTMATLGGARALGLEHTIGSLTPGMQADLIVVNLSGPHQGPAHDPASALVYASSSRDVRHVLVAGRILVKDHLLTEATGLSDTEALRRKADEQAKKVLRRAGLR